MKPRVLVLGSRGLLGSSLIKEFRLSNKVELLFTSRKSDAGVFFDPDINSIEELIISSKPNYVINCIGIIKQRIALQGINPSDVVRINSLFPLQVSDLSEKYSFQLIQIGTDCVFSGKDGGYGESSVHDSQDLYGKSKSLGEPKNRSSMLIRASFIGPEIENRLSFYEWIKNAHSNSEILGFTEHQWNGISTQVLSKILINLILKEYFYAGTFHLVPEDSVSKFELIELVKKKANRMDLNVIPHASADRIDRTLSTNFNSHNQELWKLAGFRNPPSIATLIDAIED